MRNKLQIPVTSSPVKSAIGSNVFLLVATALFFVFSNSAFAQISEDFETGIPATWTLFGNGVGTEMWTTNADGYQNTNGVSVNPANDNIGDQNTANYYLVTPQLVVPENGEIHFYTKQGSEVDNGTTYEVRISTGAQPDITGFNIVLASYTESDLNIGSQTTYEKKIIEIPESIPAGLVDIYVAFVAVNTQDGAAPTGDEWFIDSFALLEGCDEILEEDITVENITVDSALVSWTHPEATEFEIQVLPTGGVLANSGIPVSGTSFSLTNLDAYTEFDVYVRAICPNDTNSGWTGPITFQTLKYGLSCETPIEVPDISTTPYVLSDNLANYVNPDVTYTTQGGNCIAGTSTTNYLRGDKVFLSYTAPSDGLVTLTHTTFGGGDSTNNCYNSRSSLFVYDSCENVGVSCMAGLTIDTGYQPTSIDNLLVQAGQTYIIVVSSEYNSGAGICFELEISSPICAPPADIVYNNLTENSVEFSWDNVGGFADSWEYAIVIAGTGEPSGAGVQTTTNLGNVINTGLTAGTTYDIYVRAVCSGTPGIWSQPTTFTMQCTVFNTPYQTSFDNATTVNPEPCWTTIDGNGDGVTWSFIGGYATVRTQDARYENNDFYVSPQINFDGTPKRLRYKTRTTQGISTYTVRLSTTGVGVDNFTTVVVPETQVTNTNFQEVMLDLPDVTGNVNIAWIVEPNSTESALRFSIDDVVIEDKPTCPDPIDPFVANVTTDSAFLLWSPGENESQWEVAIQDLNSGIPTGSGMLVSSNFPYQATGLESGNRYEYYVRAYCDATDQSEWVGPVPFTTLCTSYEAPFFESFNDDDADTQKFCWDTSRGNWVVSETIAEISAGGSYNDYLVSPAINIDGVKELKFKYRAELVFTLGNLITPRFGLEVLMSTTNTNPGSFSVISPLEVFTNSGYIEKSIIIEANGPVYIAFRVPPEFSGHASILNIDDVSIDDAPECPNPSALTVNTVLPNGADLSWTAGYQETSWNIVVQAEGTGMPTGTAGESVTTNNYTATGLTPNTNYEFYVMSNCANGDSEWVGPFTFNTTCSAFTAPFVETFNTDSSSESCWLVLDENGDLDTWELDSGIFPYEGDQAAAMFTGHNGNNEDWLISPTITVTENQRLRYYYRVFDSFFTEDLQVLLSTNGTGLDQFTTVLYDSEDDPVLINNTEYRVKIINLPAGISGDINIAFRIPYILSTTVYRGQTLVIDNVNIEDVPACPEVTNVILENITDTQVQVSWENNGTDSPWEISVQPEGTPAPVGATDPSYLYNATTNPFTVTGLTASTRYDVYVRAVCDTGETEWTGPNELLTSCSFDNLCQYTFTLYSNFSASTTLDITQNNQVSQSLPFTGDDEGETFDVFLCSGVEFSLYFDTVGTYAPQYSEYYFEINNADGLVYTSDVGLTPRTTVYSGYASCGVQSCPVPTDLTASNTSVLTWTPGGSESEWEVAIQPLGNGTIPQSGTIVSTNSYTPTAADFTDSNAVTYEYFVRAICGTDNESYWVGPYVFVRNDDVSTALTLPINANEICNESATVVSFKNATASPEAMSCDGINGSDVWFNFTAESLIHIFEINTFSGDLRGESNNEPEYPLIVMTLYKDDGSGTLQEISCSYENLLVAMYSSELVVGDNYKLRLTLDSLEPNIRTFNLCVKTPEDLCDFNMAVNGGFETPVLGILSGVRTMVSIRTVPGWRDNVELSDNIFLWESLNAPGFTPYEGGQVPQLGSEQVPVSATDTDIRGFYRDFDTSGATLLDVSFAHYARWAGNAIQLLAGPPEGPFVPIIDHVGDQSWRLLSTEYEVPEGQDQTRFYFRAYGDNVIGNLLDAVTVVANNEIITEPFEVDCNNAIATVEANGSGTWIADETNPSPVVFADANSNTTTITGFVQPGTYTFTWKSNYCENTLELTYNGVGDMPTVETPVNYCLNATAEPLTATATGTYTLLWYTDATGGTGSTTAPTPDTSTAATTSYYVVNVDENGCEGPRAEIVVEVNDAITPELNFSYDTVCQVATENPMPILADGFATGGVFSSTTLTVNAATGEIDMASATAGSHDVLYTFDGDADSCLIAGTYTATMTFTAATVPVIGFDYGTSTYCLLSGNTATPTLNAGFTSGGTFSSETVTVDAATGVVDLTTASVGVHTIVYAVEADADTCLEGGTTSATIEVVETLIPETSFTYSQDEFCSDSANQLPVLGTNFTTGGAFSAEAGLVIDSVTGEINIAASTAGTYTVTYAILQDLATCVEASSSTYSITISEIVTPVTMFDYGTTAYCLLNGELVTPNLASGFTSGGIFSSPTLTVDATTGEVDLTSGTAGTHNVTYIYDANPDACTVAGSYTATIEIVTVTNTVSEFSYAYDLYCADSPNVYPDLAAGFTTGGTFTAEAGLSINAATGEINVAASSVGNYTVSYEILDNLASCIEGSISIFDLTILDSISVVVDGACDGVDYVFTASPENDSYNPNEVTYTWTDTNGNFVGDDSNTFNVTTYTEQNNNVTLPAQFLVTVSLGACSSTQTFTAERSSCREIPRGISPDGNGKNDTFDLTGYGVNKIEIFNRNGRKVFDFKGVYTNQWYGQTNSGNDLPDGTYFYSIKKNDGTEDTGWVFINRVQ
ncbi:choice-of-anchor J domain-containing protein [Bizionia sp. KMM 8389]